MNTPSLNEYREDRKLIEFRLTTIENNMAKLTALVYELHAGGATSKAQLSWIDKALWFGATVALTVGVKLLWK